MYKLKQVTLVCLMLFFCFGIANAKKKNVEIERIVEVDGINYALFEGTDGVYVSYKDDAGYTGDIIIPETITIDDKIRPIVGFLNEVFRENKKLKSVELRCKISKLRSFEFFHCSSLERVVLNQEIKQLDDNVFSQCHNLVNINIPDGVAYIGDGTFSNCHNIKDVILPSELVYLGKRTFYRCYSLKSIDLPDRLERVKQSTFEECVNLRGVTFGDGVLKIGKRAFLGCVNLKSPDFPEGLSHLGDKAFSKCTNIDSLVIPYFVKNIGWDTFEYCTNLKKIKFVNSSPPKVGETAFYLPSGFKGTKIPVVVPEEGLSSYKWRLMFKFGYARVNLIEDD